MRTISWAPDPDDTAELQRPGGPTLEQVRAEWKGGQAPPEPLKGTPLPCVRGTDYGQPCPAGWTKDGFLSPVCKAPADFVFSPECLQETRGMNEIPGGLSKSRKRELELQCSMHWPCAGEAGGGLVPNYDVICPDSWIFQQDGTCLAPPSYRGPCQRKQNFLMYTRGMKPAWAASCDASWPLAPAKPPKLPEPLPPRSKPSEAVWAKCARDWGAQCPVGFHLGTDGVCQAPENFKHKAILNCARLDTRLWTDQMKEAFSHACQADWPCRGEAWSAGVGPLAALAAFL